MANQEIDRPMEGEGVVETQDLQQRVAELEQQLKDRNADLAALQREFDHFTGSVAHDIRSPLRAVMSTSKMLIEDYGPMLDEDGREMLQRQIDSGKRMNALVEDILEYTRLGSGELVRSDLDVSQIAQEVAEELKGREWKSPVEITVEPGMRAFADPRLTRAVVKNLIENGVKFSSRTPSTPAKVEVNSLSQDGETVFVVKDNGRGFDMVHAGKLFHPFERLHGKELPGSGIGLANTKKIIDRHGGRIWAEAEVDKGATFYFTLI